MATPSSPFAISSSTTYCGCSDFTLSLTSILFNTTSATYQWQSSLMGQYSWSNIGFANTISTSSIASQGSSTDYQCLISILYPTPMSFTSTIVTVLTTINTVYCPPRLNDCASANDDLNNFILIGELSTQINNIGTGCAINSYDNRTQESVTLYENTNYIGQASSQYSGGNEFIAIWIDFNNNFQFESSERVTYQGLNMTYNTDFLLSVPSIALGATIGTHRMRATLAYYNTPDPCGTSSTYGETHDYTVNILSSPGNVLRSIIFKE